MYHYSTVNKYGFRHRFATCVLLVMPVVFLISIFLPPVIAPLLYPYYASQFHVGDGDVGSPASADTPAASSIAEMMENERFTVHPADPYWDDIEGPVILDNVRYYALLLPSGERISARVRMKAVTESGSEDLPDTLPVGTLRRIEPKEIRGNGAELRLTTTEYYVDMIGDFGKILSQKDFSYDLGRKLILLYFPLIFLFRVAGVHLGLFSPTFFVRRDPLLPKSDLELWAASVYAVWANSSSLHEGWPLIGGMHRGPIRVRLSRSAFRKRWGGRSGKDGLEIIQRLIQSHGIEPPTPDAAWELSQAVQLAGTLYQARLISRDDMDQAYSRAGKKIQGIFSSWDQFCENDLQAFAQWQLRSKPQKEAEKNIKKRLAIYSRLKGQNPGPYTVPWNVDLNWHPADRGGNEITRQILKEYNARI